MKTIYFHVGLHLTLNNVQYEIDRIKDMTCYLLRIQDGAIETKEKKELVTLLSQGKVVLGTNELDDNEPQNSVADLSTLSEDKQQLIEQRLKYIERARLMLGDKPTVLKLDIIIEDISSGTNSKAPSVSTVYRWWNKWEASYRDPLSLLNRKTGSVKHRTINQIVLKEFFEVVNEVYMTQQRVSKLTVSNALSRRLRKLKYQGYSEDEIKMPSRAQFYRLFKKLDPFDVMCAREGKLKAEKHFRISGAGVVVKRILERVEVDHTPLDVVVVDELTLEPIGRPTLTVYLDYYSKMMLGLEIGFEPPSEISVMKGLKNTILTKDYAQVYPSVKETWDTYGVPHALICDNGLEFHSHNLRRVCRELNIELQFCPKKQPHYKGAVERLVKTINNAVSHNLPGTTKTNIIERGDYNARQHANCTMKQVNELIHEWFINVYQNTPHRTTLRTPAELWKEGLNQVEPILPESLEKLNIITCKEALKTLSHKGIEHNNLFYNSNILIGLRRRNIKNEKVSIRFDAMDLGYIWVFDDFYDEFLKVTCTTPEYADGLSERAHKAIRKELKEKGERDFDKEKLQEYREEFTNNMLELSKEDKLSTRTKFARLNIGVKTVPNKPKTLSSSYKNNKREILNFKKFDVLDGVSDE